MRVRANGRLGYVVKVAACEVLVWLDGVVLPVWFSSNEIDFIDNSWVSLGIVPVRL